jgi:hypothetical protein
MPYGTVKRQVRQWTSTPLSDDSFPGIKVVDTVSKRLLMLSTGKIV